MQSLCKKFQTIARTIVGVSVSMREYVSINKAFSSRTKYKKNYMYISELSQKTKHSWCTLHRWVWSVEYVWIYVCIINSNIHIFFEFLSSILFLLMLSILVFFSSLFSNEINVYKSADAMLFGRVHVCVHVCAFIF